MPAVVVPADAEAVPARPAFKAVVLSAVALVWPGGVVPAFSPAFYVKTRRPEGHEPLPLHARDARARRFAHQTAITRVLVPLVPAPDVFRERQKPQMPPFKSFRPAVLNAFKSAVLRAVEPLAFIGLSPAARKLAGLSLA